MCSIVVLNHVREDMPLVLATNRDEFYARKTSGPVRLLENPRTVGGRDLEAQGTWMGVTREGLFVGVTNQRTFSMPDRTKRSRGELVISALTRENATEIIALLKTVDGRQYNSFNLMFGDARALFVAYGREARRDLEIVRVPDGVSVLPNDVLDSPDFVKVGRAKLLLAPVVNASWPELEERLVRTLSDRELPDLSLIPEPPPNALFDRARIRELAALCVRTPVYGTRSSTIVALAPGAVLKFKYADGPPDQTPFRDITALYAD